MSEAMRGALREVASMLPTAIISGRCVEKVVGFVKLRELFYAGSHGLDIQGPEEGLCKLQDPSMCSYQVCVEQGVVREVPMPACEWPARRLVFCLPSIAVGPAPHSLVS